MVQEWCRHPDWRGEAPRERDCWMVKGPATVSCAVIIWFSVLARALSGHMQESVIPMEK